MGGGGGRGGNGSGVSKWSLALYLTYLLFLCMVTTAITSGHTATRTNWPHRSTAYTGVAACALILGVGLGVSGLIMTITARNAANIAPEEVLLAEGKDPGSPLLEILGPVFLGVGVACLIAGVSMCMFARYPPRRLRGAPEAPESGECDRAERERSGHNT